MIIEKIKQVLWRMMHKYSIHNLLGKAILVLALLSGGLAYGQNDDSNWNADSPVKYQVEIKVPGENDVKGEVRMHYYIMKDGFKYYRKSNNANRKFGKNPLLDEADKLIVNIEFRPLKDGSKHEGLVLVIPSNQYIGALHCFKKSDKNEFPFQVYHGGNKELTFDLKAGCDRDSNIKIGFQFLKDSKELEFKISSANKSNLKLIIRKKKEKHTEVTIPIKVGYSNKSIADADAALKKATEAANTAKKALNKANTAAGNVEKAKDKAINAKTVEDAENAARSVIREVENMETANDDIASAVKDAKKAVNKAAAAVNASKTDKATTSTKASNEATLEKLREAEKYAEEATENLENVKNGIAKEAAEAAALFIDNATWLNEIEEKVSNQDLLTQIKSLETRMKGETNLTKKTLLNNVIIGKVETFSRQSILNADACSQAVKDFGATEIYKQYLSPKFKKKYTAHLTSCGASTPPPPPVIPKKKPQNDSQAFAAAETTNTIKSYKVYIHNFPNGKKVEDAKKIIKTIRKKDEDAWEKALAAKTDNACSNVGVFETYLKDTKHHTKYRSEAEEERKEASKKCKDFRIESKTQNGPKGIYTFEIKKGKAPFKISPINNDGAVLNSDNKIITLTILTKGDYKIQVTDKTGATTSYTVDAQHPDLKILEKEGELIVAGGQSPFDLYVEGSNKTHRINGRSIKKETLVSALGLKGNFYLQAIDNYNAKSEKQFINSAGGGNGNGGNKFLFLYFILAGILAGISFYFRNKIPFLKDLKMPGKLSEEDRLWKTAEEARTIEYYKIYEDKYPNGKYIDQIPARVEEIKEWKACKTREDFEEYYHNRPDPLFKLEALGKINALAKNDAETSANPKEGQPTPSNIDFYIDGNAVVNTPSSNATPLALSSTEYFQFDLNKHWGNTAVQSVWMSREACLEAYYLIEDAIKTAFQQDETIPEVGGFLLGTVHPKNSGSFDLQIEKFVSVTPENNGEYEVSFGQKAFIELSDAYDANPELKLMGWMHTHPGHGLFLSAKDLVVVNQHFSDPYQVSMEVDTKTRNLDTAFFSRKNDKSLNNTTTDKKEADWFHWEDVKYWLKTKPDSINKLS